MYLTGVKGPAVEPLLDDGTLGLLNTPASSYVIQPGWTFALDSGCFNASTYKGDDVYLAWLHTQPTTRCLFATAPDVVGDHDATLARSAPWLPVLRALGFPAAFVLQDGATVSTVPWDDFDVAFIGGSTAWKLGAQAKTLIRHAQLLGKPVHVGRVNSGRRFEAMAALGVDSVDGTYLAFGPDVLLPNLLAWLRKDATHAPLFDLEVS